MVSGRVDHLGLLIHVINQLIDPTDLTIDLAFSFGDLILDFLGGLTQPLFDLLVDLFKSLIDIQLIQP